MKDKKNFYWRKLDDQAKVFSLASNSKYSSVFRLSVILKEKIDKNLLQQATEIALQKYEAFKVRMRKGLFWYYFEKNEKKPVIKEESEYPFKKINTSSNNDYLFKITYFENKINIEFFHVLTDGNSGGDFFKEIIYIYLELKYPEKFKIHSSNSIAIFKDSENAYKKNYKKGVKKENSFKRAYMLKGKELSNGMVAINHFNINLSELKEFSKERNITLTILLVAMIATSIYESNYKKYNGKNPINICVPINLKKYLSSDTISNFFSYMIISLKIKQNKNYSFEDILEMVKKEYDKKMKLEKIIETISSDAGMTNNIFIRAVPLFLKKIAVRIGSLEVKRHFTLTFSNLGKIEFNDEYKEYIDDCFVILSPDWAEKTKCGICSYENKLVVTFGTILRDCLLEKKFNELLKEKNISCNIIGNGISVV